jgi:hypothetical protein
MRRETVDDKIIEGSARERLNNFFFPINIFKTIFESRM